MKRGPRCTRFSCSSFAAIPLALGLKNAQWIALVLLGVALPLLLTRLSRRRVTGEGRPDENWDMREASLPITTIHWFVSITEEYGACDGDSIYW